MSFFEDEFWAAFVSAGFLVDCTYIQPGGGVAKTVKVRWMEPDDVNMITGVQSKRYEIEYRTKDMPDLIEGVALSIKESDTVTTDYRVREAPFVDPAGGSDGTYRRAVLTREKARD